MHMDIYYNVDMNTHGMMLIKQIFPNYDDQQMMIQHEYTPFYTDQNTAPNSSPRG